MIIVIPG